MDKKRKQAIYDSIFTGLYVALVLTILSLANSFMPNNWNRDYANILIIISLIIIFMVTHQKMNLKSAWKCFNTQITPSLSLLFSGASLLIVIIILPQLNQKIGDLNFTIERIEKNAVFLKTSQCDRVWFLNVPIDEEKKVSCLKHDGKWDTCIKGFHDPYGCQYKEWFEEVRQTYTWNNTEGAW